MKTNYLAVFICVIWLFVSIPFLLILSCIGIGKPVSKFMDLTDYLIYPNREN